jgi:16S rRNA (cytidine1402-2'-O)-methyltransferase
VTDRPSGALVLVGTPIGNLGDLSPRAVDALRTADVIAAEDTRRTRALMSHAGIPSGGRLRAVHARNEAAAADRVVEEVRGGARVAVVTDAGMPGVSDPGNLLVRACLDAGLPVEAVPGPSAALTALVLSGLPAARFVFEGFLPRKGRARAEHIKAPERAPAGDAEIEAAVRAALADGRTARDAASDVANALGVARRRAYEAATRLKGSRRRGG